MGNVIDKLIRRIRMMPDDREIWSSDAKATDRLCNAAVDALPEIEALRPPSLPYSVSWEGGNEVKLRFPNDQDAEAFGRWAAQIGGCHDSD